MITTTTTLYTPARNTEEVIEGFLGGMSAGQVAGDQDCNAVADALLNHCTQVDMGGCATDPDMFEDHKHVMAFTCADIAARICRMAAEESKYND